MARRSLRLRPLVSLPLPAGRPAPTLHLSKHCPNCKVPLKCHFLHAATQLPPTWFPPPIPPLLLPLAPSGPLWHSSHVPPCWSSHVPSIPLTQSCCLCPECPPQTWAQLASSTQVSAPTSPHQRVPPCPLIPSPPRYSSVHPWPVFHLFTAACPVPRIMAHR